jgi:ribonuclease HI
MELRAAINGLSTLREQCEVELIRDSQYVKQGITEYLPRWRTNGWRTSGGQPVQNQDLWQELDDLVQQHVIHWVWIAGHADHAVQNRCDALALSAARGQAGSVEPVK